MPKAALFFLLFLSVHFNRRRRKASVWTYYSTERHLSISKEPRCSQMHINIYILYTFVYITNKCIRYNRKEALNNVDLKKIRISFLSKAAFHFPRVVALSDLGMIDLFECNNKSVCRTDDFRGIDNCSIVHKSRQSLCTQPCSYSAGGYCFNPPRLK